MVKSVVVEKSPFVIKKTTIEGFGVYTKQSFKKGQKLFVVEGKVIKDTDKRLSHRGIQIAKHLFIEPKRYSLGWFLNHSCDPNAYVDKDALFARRTIKKGEEITADYSLFTDYPTWNMLCLCGTKSCRGKIVPFRKLEVRPKKFVAAYLKK